MSWKDLFSAVRLACWLHLHLYPATVLPAVTVEHVCFRAQCAIRLTRIDLNRNHQLQRLPNPCRTARPPKIERCAP